MHWIKHSWKLESLDKFSCQINFSMPPFFLPSPPAWKLFAGAWLWVSWALLSFDQTRYKQFAASTRIVNMHSSNNYQRKWRSRYPFSFHTCPRIFITWCSTIVKTWTCSKDTWHVTWRSTCLTNPRSSALFWRLRWLHPRKISQILTEAGGKYYPEWETLSPLTWQPRRLLATLFRFSHQTILTAAIESLQSLVPGWRRQMKLNRAKVKTRRCELRMRQQAGTFQTGVWEMRQRENLTGTTHLGQFLLGSNYFIQYFLPQLLTFHGGKSWNMNSY